jgi:hypothetical protein
MQSIEHQVATLQAKAAVHWDTASGALTRQTAAAIGILLMAVYRVFRKRASPEPASVPSAVEDYGTPVAFV